MSKVTVGMAISLDGYTAGPNQSLEQPFGEGAHEGLTAWMTQEPERHEAELAALTDAGAFVMGRNMFDPGRGPHDPEWTGWWGPEPPYHAPVFVLTHYAREPIPMEGGTTFHFVTDGIESALAQARAAAGGADVSIAGGAATVNQYLAAGLVDELWLHIAPVVLGKGERLLDGVGDLSLEPISVGGTERVTHVRYRIAR
jgi:dihydrofolate reductase